MIGVVVHCSDHPLVREFFELFKTPWEFYTEGRHYDVLLCAGNLDYDARAADVTLLYSSSALASDVAHQIESTGRHQNSTLTFGEARLPIYGAYLTFQKGRNPSYLLDEASGEPALCSYFSEHRSVLRIGYDLFHEIRELLTVGQPIALAGIPTLELHIALLRDLIVAAGVPLAEIPAVPQGYRFIVCLTHDVDHPSIRRHKWDHTMAGFLCRATFGSLTNFLRGSIPLRDLLTNWAAALCLPLVYLGLARDFWQDFVRCYRNLEKELASTYFIIPFRDRPGRKGKGKVPVYRAARYGAHDVEDSIAEISAAGGEVGLHGIDAWIDSSSGREEVEMIRQVSGRAEIGSRMHWLYFDENAPSVLEKAGITYDSTIGYGETVGFRAGTAQAYKPLRAEQLLELPLHVMDTALFYPAYLGLSLQSAAKVLDGLADQAERFGGCLTINWHDRSLAPERLWYACYQHLLHDLRARGAWFATGGQAVAWFRKRRSAAFGPAAAVLESSAHNGTGSSSDDRLPGLQLRTHKRQVLPDRSQSPSFVDVPLSPSCVVQMAHATGE